MERFLNLGMSLSTVAKSGSWSFQICRRMLQCSSVLMLELRARLSSWSWPWLCCCDASKSSGYWPRCNSPTRCWTKGRENKLRRKERLKEKERDKEKKCSEFTQSSVDPEVSKDESSLRVIQKGWHPGCTANGGPKGQNELFVVNANDCKIILCLAGCVFALRRDHIVSYPEKRECVINAGNSSNGRWRL
ncbi:Protein kinase and PP2C-like domain-containing protein [Vitis vinifera]|uniref:Protein kinase and PP2C-like domain-containing protein n=1 Tax=Vitis vinifera TaxID=29760 RepID=A0A438ED25_VITVI|nr:Protein kinase and PP2C-like domain-containing protein [Vitis vinifera]